MSLPGWFRRPSLPLFEDLDVIFRAKLLTQVVDGLDRRPAEIPVLRSVVHLRELLDNVVGDGNVAIPPTALVPMGNALGPLTEPGYLQLGDVAVGKLVAVVVIGHGLAKGGVADSVPLEEFLDFLGVDHVYAFLGYDIHVDGNTLEVMGPRARLLNADDGHDDVGFGASFLARCAA
jgi:hypothetical protein